MARKTAATPPTTDQPLKGLAIARRFTRPDEDAYSTVEWVRRDSRITNTDGSVVFEMADCEVPASWSQVATDIVVSKYFRKAGVPQTDADGRPVLDDNDQPVTGPERSVRQVVHRLTGCWRYWGQKHGYFASDEDAEAFEAELAYMLLHQMVAPNSPQWFNTGLNWAYGLTGPAQGHYYADPATGDVQEGRDAYTHPQPHACFIQSVQDDLVNEGGIMDLWQREARLFKYGSGTGTNFSNLRGEGEPLSGGGKSSGLMSFLKIGDRAAGAIKSGGTTRRAAKMVCLDLDHPDIEQFVDWKVNEERKVAALIAAGFDSDFNGEAYATVSGQNANNSVRVPNAFLKAVEAGGAWDLHWRTDGRVAKTVDARALWERIARAAWACADPGVQFDTTINEWHTCPAAGPIRASNPCSEYMFIDNTACNLASLNLVKFEDPKSGRFDIDAYRHAIRLWTMVLEISVLMAQYPSEEIARLSYEYRTLGLGYANIGSLLMRRGLPYDSAEGRTVAAALTAIMTGEAYATSAEMAAALGPFPRFAANRGPMLRVIRNHRAAAYGDQASYEGLSVLPQGLDQQRCPSNLLAAAHEAWYRAVSLGEKYGYRNAQTTVIAPTGTIGLLMDCDTTGIEPDFSLVKFKKLAGGGYLKIANQSIAAALQFLGYANHEIHDILTYVLGTNRLEGAPHINRETLKAHGLTDADCDQIDAILPSVFDLAGAINAWNLGDDALRRLHLDPAQAKAPGFNILPAIGFSCAQARAASDAICGHQTIEGAPHLKAEHLPVFDCAAKCGQYGQRSIAPEGHIRMLGATQPFVSGAISKTINMPHETTVEQIEEASWLAWRLGLKAVAIYRDGCKLSQPLNSGNARGKEEEQGAAAQEPAPPIPNVRSPREARDLAGQGQAGFTTPTRWKLPSKRHGWTQEATVGGHKVYLRTGEYKDGTLGEIFIDLAKDGAAFRSLMNCFAIAISKGLQYGVPLEEFVDTFTFTRFAPHGMVEGHPNVKMATSIIDYVFRVLGLEYLGRTDFVQVPPDKVEQTTDASADRLSSGEPGETGAATPKQDAASGRVTVRGVLAPKPVPAAGPTGSAALNPQKQQLESMTTDAPFCDICGHITVRNGACYKCLNCGNSMGCS
ncbi:MAG TPA: vitamin B12-dependent ribonucleotide reductase [bacterium]